MLSEPLPDDPNGHHLLLVEDDDDTREALTLYLASAGYEVVGARDGLEALEALERGPGPCVILLDLMMPRMNGIEFRSRQQANPGWADIPTVLVSANLTPEIIQGLGADAVVPKPIDPDALLAVVDRYC